MTSVDVLKKLNDAVFFPAASKRNLNSGSVYNSDGKGWYWTSYAGSSTTNAQDIAFDGINGGFFYKVIQSTNNSSFARYNQMAVRLLVEVTE